LAQSIGLIGLGRMGLAMAARLVEAYGVVAWDVSDRALARAGKAGAARAAGPGELAARTAMALLSLPAPEQVESVLLGPDGILARAAAGYIVVDMTTGDPSSSARFAAMATARSVHYLDAPVLGRPDKCGEWTLPTGGDPDALERAKPVLLRVARRVEHVGPAGRGMAVKLLNNLMFATINVITAEVASLGEELGIDPGRLFDVIAGSEAATVSPLFKSLMPKMIERAYDPVFTVDLLAKDLRLAVRMAEERGIPLIVPRALQTAVDAAQAQGLGPYDSAAVYEMFRRFQSGGNAPG